MSDWQNFLEARFLFETFHRGDQELSAERKRELVASAHNIGRETLYRAMIETARIVADTPYERWIERNYCESEEAYNKAISRAIRNEDRHDIAGNLAYDPWEWKKRRRSLGLRQAAPDGFVPSEEEEIWMPGDEDEEE